MTERAEKERRWTLEEFLAWAEGQDQVWELVDGTPVPKMMATPKVRHQDVAGNAYFHLRRQLRSPCRAFENIAVPTKDDGGARVPDILVNCNDYDSDANRIAEPVLAIEVLSDSTRLIDFNDKLAEYQGKPSIRYVVLIEARECEVRMHERTEGEWITSTYTSLDDTLVFPEIDATLSVRDLYENVPLPPRLRVVRDE